MEMLDQINALQNELKSVVAEKTAMDQMLFQQLQNVLALKKEIILNNDILRNKEAEILVLKQNLECANAELAKANAPMEQPVDYIIE
jgi:hypothetical protein